MSILPIPSTFGLDGEKFPEWRQGQAQAINAIICSPSATDLLVCPTGFGKSVMYITTAILHGGRVLILTSTKALQTQLMTDFSGLCVEVKGKANYRCRKLPVGRWYGCDKGPCNYGEGCGYKEAGCGYYDAVRVARSARIVVTNYSFWIYNNKMLAQGDGQGGIGDFDMIVLDEAHDAPGKVADAYSTKFSGKRNDVERELLSRYNWGDDNKAAYRTWAQWAVGQAKEMLRDAKRNGHVMTQYRANNAIRKLRDTLHYVGGDRDVLIMPDAKNNQLHTAIIWPFGLAKDVLFTGASKVVLTSATVRPKTADMLGVDSGEYRLFEYPHNIPLERRMLYHIPCVRMNYRTTPAQMQTWLTKFESIAKARADWKGLFHTISYGRRDYVMKNTRFASRMMSHGRGDAGEVIVKFKGIDQPQVLVSPSIMTGYDFPYDDARWQVIGKIPYPNTTDPVTKARCDKDKEYAPYQAMQSLVQTTGRIVRAADDWGETFIIDDNIGWFWRRHPQFAPEWFRGALRTVDYAPPPKEW